MRRAELEHEHAGRLPTSHFASQATLASDHTRNLFRQNEPRGRATILRLYTAAGCALIGTVKPRKTKVINFRVTEDEEQQLAAQVDATADSPDKVARKLMLDGLRAKEQERRASAYSIASAPTAELLEGDALRILSRLPSRSCQMCLTSPPYWQQRDYGDHPEQLGREKTPEQFVNRLADIFSEVHRVLAPDGTLWVNIDDTYWRKQLAGIPWLLAHELKRRGWLWRAEIVWAKASTPEAVRDRPTRAHEPVLLFAKRRKYFYNYEAMLEPHDNPWTLDCIRKAKEQGLNGRPRNNPFDKDGRYESGKRGITRAEFGAMMNPNGKNRRDVWFTNTEKFRGPHSAVMPVALAELCVRAGSRPGDTVLDPFAGVSTTGIAALIMDRKFLGVELFPRFIEAGLERLRSVVANGTRSATVDGRRRVRSR